MAVRCASRSAGGANCALVSIAKTGAIRSSASLATSYLVVSQTSKNFRRQCAQHATCVIGPGAGAHRIVEPLEPGIAVALKEAGEPYQYAPPGAHRHDRDCRRRRRSAEPDTQSRTILVRPSPGAGTGASCRRRGFSRRRRRGGGYHRRSAATARPLVPVHRGPRKPRGRGRNCRL